MSLGIARNTSVAHIHAAVSTALESCCCLFLVGLVLGDSWDLVATCKWHLNPTHSSPDGPHAVSFSCE